MRRRKLVTTYLIGVTLRNSTLLLLRSSVRVTYRGIKMNARQHHSKKYSIIKSFMGDAWAEPIIEDLFNTDINDMTVEQLVKVVERDILELQTDYNKWSNENV